MAMVTNIWHRWKEQAPGMLTAVVTPQQWTVAAEMTAAVATAMAAAFMVAAMFAVMGDSSSDGCSNWQHQWQQWLQRRATAAVMATTMGNSSSDGNSNGQYKWQLCRQWQQWANHGNSSGNDCINRRQQWAVAIGDNNGGCLDGDGCALIK